MEEQEEVVIVGDLLDNTIIGEINNIKEKDPDKRKQIIEGLEKLYKLRIEENRISTECYNNDQNREMERADRDRKYELDLQKLKLETARMEAECLNMEKDIDVKAAQAKTEKHKMWLDIGSRGVAIAVWVVVSFKVMKFEETGSIRSKAFTGTMPKLKFW